MGGECSHRVNGFWREYRERIHAPALQSQLTPTSKGLDDVQCAAANGLSAVRSSVAGIRERTVRSTRPAEAVAELGSLGGSHTS